VAVGRQRPWGIAAGIAGRPADKQLRRGGAVSSSSLMNDGDRSPGRPVSWARIALFSLTPAHGAGSARTGLLAWGANEGMMAEQPSIEWQVLMEAWQRVESPQPASESARAAWEAWKVAVRTWQKAEGEAREAEAERDTISRMARGH
jgi:hypothetical protein